MSVDGVEGTARTVHWEDYYRGSTVPQVPSQFAVFMQDFLPAKSPLIEFGCGNGRDTLYFAAHGYQAVGIDGAEAATESCARQADAQGLRNVLFLNHKVGHDDGVALSAKLGGLPHVDHSATRNFYARFFLHAITEAEEDALLKLFADLSSKDSLVGLEFRTSRDEALQKETKAHYRRYIHPASVVAKAAGLGFDCIYQVEGFGFAKYKQDDAHVARLVLRKKI